MNKRLLTVPALGALLAFGPVACSDDNTAQLDTWAKSVCDAAKGPIGQSRVALADTEKIIPGEVPVDLQKRLSADLATLAGANNGLADAVAKVGAPKSEDGAASQTSAVNELRQAGQGYQDAQKKLDALTTTDQARFADGLRSVGDQVQQLAQLSTQGLNRLQTGEAGDAMKRQAGCKANAAPQPSEATATAVEGQATETGGASAAPSAKPSGGKTSSAPSGRASGSPAATSEEPAGDASAEASPSESSG
ncbi:hypothetical protein KNE206_10600 [Kitasatospora sp. NE20-6]|uniref:hypothetical protein n=1 Tax=Kitasatospora sp. NE20-6 TaxID=2859066 RepID=UPI0034DC97E7